MREIKFRLWYCNTKTRKSNGRMCYNFGLDGVPSILTDDNKSYLRYPNNFSVNNIFLRPGLEEWVQYEVMQYTGLKDKNKKEIYEGDIVKYDTSSIGGKIGTGIVKWCDDFTIGSYPGWMLWCPGWAYRMELIECEIIGNIYENPELLKCEK